MARTIASALLILLGFQPTPASFTTRARVSVDRTVLALVSAVATVEPRAPGYRWLRVHFYAYPLTAADATAAMKGNIDALERRWKDMAATPAQYNVSHAVLQLGIDKDAKVWQVDLSVPGYACTIAASDREANVVLQEYQFDGARLRLKSKGTHPCEKFGWDIDVSIPVFATGAQGR
jgi:hypothetical protein